MTAFSDRLKEERKRLDLSQGEMAAVGGVSMNSQSNYENGHRSPDAEYLSRAASVGVDVGYLLTGIRAAMASEPLATDSGSNVPDEPVMRPVTREQAALLDNYENADDEGRDAARRVLVALSKSKAAKKAA